MINEGKTEDSANKSRLRYNVAAKSWHISQNHAASIKVMPHQSKNIFLSENVMAKKIFVGNKMPDVPFK